MNFQFACEVVTMSTQKQSSIQVFFV